MARKSKARKSSKVRSASKRGKGRPSGGGAGRKGEREAKEPRRHATPFPPEVRQQALELILRGVPRAKIAQKLGCTTETLRLWARAAEKELQARSDGMNAEAPSEKVSTTEAPSTHTGNLPGLEATGRSIRITGITIYRFADGMISEAWEELDMLGMWQQLGVVSLPGDH